jgi:ABC-2 type transport system ATP-binding protein
MSTLIHVNHVSRSFNSLKKEEGWKGALKLLYDRQYSTHQALEDVSFSIESGSFVGLIGANGAGKTTLLKILSGLLPPSTGEVSVLGETPFHRSRKFRKSIALVMGQKAQLWWDLPAIDAFELIRAVYEISTPDYRERLSYLSELLDVTKHLQTQIRRLSLGERMKMELIGALLHWPQVVYLDEPTIGLDVLAAHKLREFLKTYNRQNKSTIILTSHNMDDIEQLCSRVMILKSGKMLYDGTPGKLLNEGERVMKVTLKETTSVSELAGHTAIAESAIEATSSGPNVENPAQAQKTDATTAAQTFRIKLLQTDVPRVLQKIMSGNTLLDMALEEPDLESVIQRIYEKGDLSE